MTETTAGGRLDSGERVDVLATSDTPCGPCSGLHYWGRQNNRERRESKKSGFEHDGESQSLNLNSLLFLSLPTAYIDNLPALRAALGTSIHAVLYE